MRDSFVSITGQSYGSEMFVEFGWINHAYQTRLPLLSPVLDISNLLQPVNLVQDEDPGIGFFCPHLIRMTMS